jgi:hypothetical protein
MYLENPAVYIRADYFGIAASVRPKTDVRYYLEGVCVEPAESGAIMVCTDGHRMIAMRDREGICNAPVILRVDSRLIQDCNKKYGKVARHVILTAERDALLVGDAYVADKEDAEAAMKKVNRPFNPKSTYINVDPIYMLPCKPLIDGDYPDWRRVLPKEEELHPGLVGDYNADYLRDFEALAGRIDWKYHSITFFHHKPAADPGDLNRTNAGAMIVRSPGNPDFLGMLMPMHQTPLGSTLPDWSTEPPPKPKKAPAKARRRRAAETA